MKELEGHVAMLPNERRTYSLGVLGVHTSLFDSMKWLAKTLICQVIRAFGSSSKYTPVYKWHVCDTTRQLLHLNCTCKWTHLRSVSISGTLEIPFMAICGYFLTSKNNEMRRLRSPLPYARNRRSVSSEVRRCRSSICSPHYTRINGR